MSRYALPLVGRAGLGNELFPWARAELYARGTGTRIVAPQWASLRIGPWLRREPDKRRYGGIFRAPHHVHGARAAALRLVGRRVAESAPHASEPAPRGALRPELIVFAGLGGYFAPLAGSHAYLREQLWAMTRTALRPAPASAPFVAMHVRRGDVTRQGMSRGELEDSPVYTPLAWFVAMARALRRDASWRAAPIVVFTDGSADEVRELCAVEGVVLRPRAPAVTDLWAMAGATALFASGFSTFSMWASFLGRMPTFYAPGKLQQRLLGGDPGALEMELAPDAPLPRRPT